MQFAKYTDEEMRRRYSRLVSRRNSWSLDELSIQNVLDRLDTASMALMRIPNSDRSQTAGGSDYVRESHLQNLVTAWDALEIIQRYLPMVECWVTGYWYDWGDTDRWTSFSIFGGFTTREQAADFAYEYERRTSSRTKRMGHRDPYEWQVSYGPCPLWDVVHPDATPAQSDAFLH